MCDRGMSTKRFEDWSARHEVPDELAVVLDFANTVDFRNFGRYEPREFLPDRESLDAWLVHRGFPRTRSSEADFAQAMDLRASIRVLAKSHQRGHAESEGVRDFRRAFDLPLHARLDDRGEFDLVGAQEGARGALADILARVVLAAARGSWSRVKMCSAPDCQVVFYDKSKARTSRWCSTTGCGNRVKTRTYRARRRTGAN